MKNSGKITLSVAVTAHAEGRLLRPTMRSIAAAITTIVDQGIACELVIVLDNPSPETSLEAERWLEPGRVPVPVRVLPFSFGDAGASRNAAAKNARGRYVAFCDGDDLVTRNYFAVGLEMLEQAAEPLIIHPSLVISFGARSAKWVIPATETIDHLDLIRHNLWPSSSISQRDTYLKHPYEVLPASEGFGPEDWLWNIQTSIDGIPHRPAPDTMFFYRVRESGGVNNRHLTSILPPFDIDRLREVLPSSGGQSEGAPDRPRPRERLRNTASLMYQGARAVGRPATAGMKPARRRRLRAQGQHAYIRMLRLYRRIRPLPPIPEVLTAALLEAAEIEPALSWTADGIREVPDWAPVRDPYAPILISLVEQLRGHAQALVAVPWVGIGGADLVSLNYARALLESDRFGGEVAMLATYLPSRTHRELVPDGVTFVQIPEDWRELHPDLQRRLLAQVILLVRPQVVVSVNCFDVTNSLQKYGRQLGATTRIFLTLFAFDRIGVGYPTNPITDDSQRAYLDEIASILTDNTVTRSIVEDTLALDGDRVYVQHQPALEVTPALRTDTRAHEDEEFTAERPFRLLWPHRLDKEKRPDALVAIAERLREERLPVEIEIYGQQVLSVDGAALMKSLLGAGVKYHGPYSGGLASLATDQYHALLLTSESEGLPLVLVQSMLLGLPVISTAVGGVTDIVHDGETGLLAQDPDDVDGFIVAIRRLMESRDLRRSIIASAYEFAKRQHSWETFARGVDSSLR